MTQFTKQAIIRTFISLLEQKPLSKITVKEVTSACGINRNTFYYHFEDIYSMVEEIFDTELQRLVEAGRGSGSLADICFEALSYINVNKTVINNIYNSLSRDKLEQFLFDALDQPCLEFVAAKAEGLDVPADSVAFIARYHKYAIVGFLLDWLGRGMKEDMLDLLHRIGNLSEQNIKEYLRSSFEALNPPGNPPSPSR